MPGHLDHYKPRVIFLVVIVSFFMFLMYWVNQKPNYDHIPRQNSWNAAGGFSLYYPVQRLSKNNDNIFFIETSCTSRLHVGKKRGGIDLNPRQACAIYSAAKKNPSKRVVIFYSCFLGRDYYEKSSDYIKTVLDLPNVAVVNMDVIDVYLGSTLKPIVMSGKLAKSRYPVEHNADIIRILLIYLYGGTYMDMDVISLTSLDALGHNYIGAAEDANLGTGVFQFDYEGVGHDYLEKILVEVVEKYDPYSWSENGPKLAGRVLKRYCGKPENVNWSTAGWLSACNITVHPTQTFYPIDYRDWKMYYDEKQLDSVLEKLKDTYVVHMWNFLSRDAIVKVGSQQPYAVLARDHCAPVYWKSNPLF